MAHGLRTTATTRGGARQRRERVWRLNAIAADARRWRDRWASLYPACAWSRVSPSPGHHRSDDAARSAENTNTKRRRQESRQRSAAGYYEAALIMSACGPTDDLGREDSRHRQLIRVDAICSTPVAVWLKHLSFVFWVRWLGTRVFG